jgi:aminoglycoside phosphotransferase (APT) family kinase protein
MKHRGNPALDDSEQAILTDLLGLVDLVDSRWGEVESFCASMPRVLVHGDLIARNVCMRFDGGAPLVLAIDWEKAGWGIPSIDLAQAPVPSPQFSADADVVSYCDVVRSTWPRMDREMLEHSAWYATIFRCLSALHWDARYLRLDWPHRTMAKVEYYRSALRMACERAGLGVD